MRDLREQINKQPLPCGEGGTAEYSLGKPGSGRSITDGHGKGGAWLPHRSTWAKPFRDHPVPRLAFCQ